MLRSSSSTTDTDTDVDTPTISFRNTSPLGQTTQWSDSTDVAEFIREAARSAKFSITVEYPPIMEHSDEPDDTHVNDIPSPNHGQPPPPIKTSLEVDVPTFEDRTHYIRKRLQLLERQLRHMDELKRSCDKEARRGAQRMALGGFGMLIVYWGAVARLTFWDYGWYVHPLYLCLYNTLTTGLGT
jgi:calcium uniporter protein, mitochondrial